MYKSSSSFVPLRNRGDSINSAGSYSLNATTDAFAEDQYNLEQNQPAQQKDISLRLKISAFMYSTRVQLVIMLLVLIDVVASIIELLVEARAVQVVGEPSEFARVCQFTSLSIVLLFVVEMAIKMCVLRHHFLIDKGNIADALIVIVSLIIELIFIESNAGSSEVGSLIIAGRWWRLVALVRNYITRMRRDAEERLRNEFELRMTAENEVILLRASRDALELERNALRELLTRSGIDYSELNLLRSGEHTIGTKERSAQGDLTTPLQQGLFAIAESNVEQDSERLPISISTDASMSPSFGSTRLRERFEIENARTSGPATARMISFEDDVLLGQSDLEPV